MFQEKISAFDRATRGLVAGGCGGIAGGAAKLLGEVIFPPRYPGEPVPPVVAVSKALQYLSGSPLLPSHETLATQVFHWNLSIAMAAAYGVVVEFFPRARIGNGAGFGLVVLILTHETTLPLLGLSLPWKDIPIKEHLSEIFTHTLYGIGAEVARRLVRRQFVSDSSPTLGP